MRRVAIVGLALLSSACERAPVTTAPPTATAATTPRAAGPLQLDAPGLFAEGVAWDPVGARVLLGGIVGQQIVAGSAQGGATERFAAPGRGWSVFGVAVDRERALVWAACAATPHGRVPPKELGRAGLFAFSLADGAQIHERLTPAGDGGQHLFGDLAVLDDGRVMTTDSIAGGVWSARPDDDDLAVVAPAGTFRSAQGLVAIDPHTLVVADYTTGLVRVRLDDAGTSSSVDPLATPPGEELRGIDGLAHRGTAIAAVQNGVAPHRILRVEIAADAASITSIEVLHTIPATAGEPTLATIVDDAVWVTQTDRWDRVFAEDGRPRADVQIASPTILRLPFRAPGRLSSRAQNPDSNVSKRPEIAL